MARTTNTKDLEGRIADWLRGTLGRDDVTDVDLEVSLHVPEHGGMSNDTLLVDATWAEGGTRRERSIVLKMEPGEPALFPGYDLEREASVLQAVADHSDVAVPDVLAVEPDPGPLGRPFFAMGTATGRIPADDPPYFLSGWLHDATPEQQETALDSALDTMAAIHALDAEILPAPGAVATPGAAGIDADVHYWRRYLEWLATDGPVPVLPAALEWCASNRPQPSGRDVLCWGDARMGNLVFGDDFGVSCVLDWEMAGPAPAGTDLGWFLFAHDTALMWMDDLPGFRDREGMLERYTRSSGRQPDDLHWYEVWAGVRAGAVHLRRSRISGDDPRGETPLMLSLRRLVELP
ncbi:MAG: phosphotransferase family protein [Acidimicrobiia bacterium]